MGNKLGHKDNNKDVCLLSFATKWPEIQETSNINIRFGWNGVSEYFVSRKMYPCIFLMKYKQ